MNAFDIKHYKGAGGPSIGGFSQERKSLYALRVLLDSIKHNALLEGEALGVKLQNLETSMGDYWLRDVSDYDTLGAHKRRPYYESLPDISIKDGGAGLERSPQSSSILDYDIAEEGATRLRITSTTEYFPPRHLVMWAWRNRAMFYASLAIHRFQCSCEGEITIMKILVPASISVGSLLV